MMSISGRVSVGAIISQLALSATAASGATATLSVDELIAHPAELDGKIVQVRGWVGRDISRKPRAELLMTMPDGLAPGVKLLGIAQQNPVARRLIPFIGRQVILTARFDAGCFAANALCIHNRDDLIPIAFTLVTQAN